MQVFFSKYHFVCERLQKGELWKKKSALGSIHITKCIDVWENKKNSALWEFSVADLPYCSLENTLFWFQWLQSN